jgi:uncharacterized alkaline shock family protein YloU
MSLDVDTGLGHIEVDEEVIAIVAGGAAMECAGLVGMVSKNSLRDGFAELLHRESFGKGIVIRRDGEALHIDLYVILTYGVQIREVAANIQSRVAYAVQEMLGLEATTVNVYVQSVKVIET